MIVSPLGSVRLRRLGLTLGLTLLAAAAGIVVIAAAYDVWTRDASPEALVRGYFAALERGDLDAALQAIEPSARPTSSVFVANMLNNVYRIEGVAVRQASILERLRGEPGDPREVTIFLAITQSVDGVHWEAGPRVPLINQDRRWYLARPPFAD
jgi:hypothetical protein